MFGRSTGSFDRLLEKATSQLLLEPDWDSILQICDAVRQGDVQSKYLITSLKKKLTSENPHVSMFAWQVLESVVKNCGNSIHVEVASKEFMEFMKDQGKVRTDPVKAKILELIQVWSHAFRNEPGYKAVQDTYHLMKMEGHTFPSLKEADAMFLAEKAPEWKDGECCHRCRVQFSMVQRKHHCRNCGQIFCGKCSSKASIIPKFGIEREVRVCEACFDLLSKPNQKKGDDDDLPAEYLASPLSQQSQVAPQRTEAEIQEEEELQLALALSKSEADRKDKERLVNNYTSHGSSNGNSVTSGNVSVNQIVQPPSVMSAPVLDTSDMDPELARYLNRNYWEQKQDKIETSSTQPSAPSVAVDAKTSTAPTTIKLQEKFQNGEVNDEQQFLNALQSSLEIFVNRMKSNSQRGRSIANDSSVQTLFMTINAMHPQLMKHIGEQEDARGHYELLQDKLAQMKDAREALDALREEHREKRRQEMEELERQRQIQIGAKLQVMRQKKQEYLEFQRQLTLQRMQEQERERQMRFEQQKQMQHMKAMQTYYPQQMYAQQPGAGFSPAGSVEGSPLHQPHMTSAQYQPAAPGPQALGMTTGAPGHMPPSTVAQVPASIAGHVHQPNGQPGTANLQQGGYAQAPVGGYHASPPMGYQSAPGGAAPPPQQIAQGQQHLQQQQPFNTYNVQGGPVQHQGQYNQPAPSSQHNFDSQHAIPPGGQAPTQMAAPQAADQQVPSHPEAQLISFD